MVRLLIYIVFVLLLGFGFSWLADRPGELVITWQQQQIETSLMVAVSAIVALIALIMFGWWLVKSLLLSPQIATRYFRARRRDRGYQALSTGLIAAGAGDAKTARKMTQRTVGLLSADQEPLIHLLDAQTAMIEGRNDAARAKFEAMVDDPETRELGLRGLYLEARRLGATEAARHYAEQAAEKSPHLPWAAEATLGFRSVAGDWDDAIQLLEKERAARVIDKGEADRKRAVLLTARGIDRLENGDVAAARADCVEANRLAPDLEPAAITAARALYREGNYRKGSNMLEKVWKLAPHPEVAETYIRARPGDSTHDRLKRAQRLESLKRNNVESLYAVARSALDAQEFELAREKAEAAARSGAREGIYLLLADIEEADTGDQARVRHWLTQAVRAPRDPAWTADGYVSEHWAPVSPVSGRLDAFEWKVPVEQIDGPVEDGEALRASADRAIASLPPVAAPVAVAAASSALVIDGDASEATGGVGETVEEVTTVVTELPPEPAAEAKAADKEPVEAEAPIKQPADKNEVAIAEEKPAPASSQPEPEVAEEATVAAVESEPVIEKAAASGATHIVTDAVGTDSDSKKAAFLAKQRPDDPGVADTSEQEETKSRFRLF